MLIVIGSELHNTTEGFEFVTPIAAIGERPTRRYPMLPGLIGSGPTSAEFWLASSSPRCQRRSPSCRWPPGPIQNHLLLAMARRTETKELTSYGITNALVAGFLTYATVTLGGA